MKSTIVFLVFACGGMASAATITQIETYSFIPTGSAVLVFDKFDPSLGTLDSVTITTNVTKTGGSLYVDNESSEPASGDISQSVTITLSSSDVDLLAAPSGSIGVNITATSTYTAVTGPDDGDGSGVQNTGEDYDGTAFGPVSVSETKTVRAIVQSGYEGVGTYSITANGSQGFDTSAIGGAAVAIDPASVSGNVTVTYTYTPIPEPASALLGGLGILTLLRRRRR